MNGRFVFKNLACWVIFFGGLILSSFTVQASAGTSVKTFDFGVGGDNPTFRSHARSFLVPQAVQLGVRISYRTVSDAPIAITVELENSESRIVQSRDGLAEKSAKQIVISVSAADNTVFGCEKGWQVRVKSKDGQVPPARVFGEINFSFIDSPAAGVSVESRPFSLKKGAQVNSRIGAAETFLHTGTINIRASWAHNPLTGALPLKFELVRPDNSVAKTLVAYGTNSAGSPKMDFDYRIVIADTRQQGAWRLKITNDTEQEISEINPVVNFTRRCFE